MCLIDGFFSRVIQTSEMMLFRIYYPCISKEFTSSHLAYDGFVFFREKCIKQYCIRNEKIARESRADKWASRKDLILECI